MRRRQAWKLTRPASAVVLQGGFVDGVVDFGEANFLESEEVAEPVVAGVAVVLVGAVLEEAAVALAREEALELAAGSYG